MYVDKKILNASLAGVLSCALLAVGSVNAQGRGSAQGYVTDSGGNIVRSGTGDCVHSSSWKPEMATVVGCDGVTLDAQVEVIKGAASGMLATVLIPAAALFSFDSDEFSESGKQAIEEYRDTLRPELAEAYAGIIVGHTDNSGNADYNLDLSKRRAQAVSDYLVETGTPAEKLRVVGLGETDPLASNDTKEGRTENRRVEIVVIGEARALDTIRFPSVALFPRRSAVITEKGMELLEKNRGDAREQLKRATYIEVVGHTDDVGDDDYNQDLSEKRAAVVANYLIEAGVPAHKIVSVGAGEKMPIASNSTEEGRAENRRVEVLVLGRTEN
ncbi:MAG: OmpA family protein [Gammaproteobacteria bacterium]|nr:OmpA family protein [Gammaproteobacteria bacterium]